MCSQNTRHLKITSSSETRGLSKSPVENQILSSSVSLFLSVFTQQTVYQAEGLQQRQTEHLSVFVQHQQLQQHHRRNRSSGRTGDSECNTHKCLQREFIPLIKF